MNDNVLKSINTHTYEITLKQHNFFFLIIKIIFLETLESEITVAERIIRSFFLHWNV